jgi:hypothetical protein
VAAGQLSDLIIGVKIFLGDQARGVLVRVGDGIELHYYKLFFFGVTDDSTNWVLVVQRITHLLWKVEQKIECIVKIR